MKVIDGKVYVNSDDARKAMFEELEDFKGKDASGEIILCIGLTLSSLISRLFKTEGSEQDEH